MSWLDNLRESLDRGECLTLEAGVLEGDGCALSLAPHPDDPETVAVLLEGLVDGGWELYWAIVTGGWAGVLDDYVGVSRDTKKLVRAAEQEEAAHQFGLPDDHLDFLELKEGENGELLPTRANREAFFEYLTELSADLVILPWGDDENATHRLVHAWFEEWLQDWPEPVAVLLNEDPKSREFKADLRLVFGEKKAQWKASQLECHRSQSIRNQRQRNTTLARRILSVNQADPDIGPGQYAERFAVRFHAGSE